MKVNLYLILLITKNTRSMKSNNRILTILILLFIISFSSCNFNCVEPRGPIITDSKVLESFTDINISIPANIKLVIGGEPKISIKACESYIHAIGISVSNNKLLIDGDVCNAKNNDIEITISTTEIEDIKISGGASLYSETPLKPDDLDLRVDGSGNISLNVFTNSIDCEINGSSNIIMNGTCKDLDIDINGSGDFKGIGLKSYKAKIKINGSGKASIVVHNRLHATVNGNGEINYSGNPEININISGSGKIEKIN